MCGWLSISGCCGKLKNLYFRCMPISRKLIIVLVLIIAMSFCADLITTRWLTRDQPLAEAHKLERIQQTYTDEVPIFGNSRAEMGYYTPALGERTFNYGFPNQSFDIQLLLLAFELAKQKTTPVIIDVHHGFFEHDPVTNINITTYLPFVRSEPQIRTFLEDQGRMKPYYLIPGMRYFGAYTAYMEPLTEHALHPDRQSYIRGGIYAHHSFSAAAKERRVEKKKEKTFRFNVDTARDGHLRALIEQHPERSFVFVLSPYHSSSRETLENRNVLVQYFKALDNQYEQVVFIEAAGYPDAYFKDTIHLNMEGATQFSHDLHAMLSARGIVL